MTIRSPRPSRSRSPSVTAAGLETTPVKASDTLKELQKLRKENDDLSRWWNEERERNRLLRERLDTIRALMCGASVLCNVRDFEDIPF